MVDAKTNHQFCRSGTGLRQRFGYSISLFEDWHSCSANPDPTKFCTWSELDVGISPGLSVGTTLNFPSRHRTPEGLTLQVKRLLACSIKAQRSLIPVGWISRKHRASGRGRTFFLTSLLIELIESKACKIESSAMRMLWCWRCKTEMPMLDDDEVGQVMLLLPNAATRVKTREDHQAMFAPMLTEYARITGFRETNPNVVFHHFVSLYGPPCRYCGRPLRTPHTKLCGRCMRPRV
jgi:hypothetical protein